MQFDPKDLYGISFYEYGEAYFGSFGGKRYRVALDPLKNIHYTPLDQRGNITLKVTVWPEPYSYTATSEDEKVSRNFDFSEIGLAQAADWLGGVLAEGTVS